MTEKEAYKECVDAIQSAEKRFFVNLYSELFFHFWQAAWEARGKHDAEKIIKKCEETYGAVLVEAIEAKNWIED